MVYHALFFKKLILNFDHFQRILTSYWNPILRQNWTKKTTVCKKPSSERSERCKSNFSESSEHDSKSLRSFQGFELYDILLPASWMWPLKGPYLYLKKRSFDRRVGDSVKPCERCFIFIAETWTFQQQYSTATRSHRFCKWVDFSPLFSRENSETFEVSSNVVDFSVVGFWCCFCEYLLHTLVDLDA